MKLRLNLHTDAQVVDTGIDYNKHRFRYISKIYCSIKFILFVVVLDDIQNPWISKKSDAAIVTENLSC